MHTLPLPLDELMTETVTDPEGVPLAEKRISPEDTAHHPIDSEALNSIGLGQKSPKRTTNQSKL